MTTGWGEDPPAQWGLVGTEGDLRKIRTEPGRYQAFYAGLVAALQDGAPLPVDPAESVAVLEILEAARRSASGREIVQVAPTSETLTRTADPAAGTPIPYRFCGTGDACHNLVTEGLGS